MIRTAAVHKVTTLLVVRYRLEITLPGSRATLTQVAEDAQFLGFTATGDHLTWLPAEQVDALLSTAPAGNVDDALARTQLVRALGRLDSIAEHLAQKGHAAADSLVAEHRDVRSASRAGGPRGHRETAAPTRRARRVRVPARSEQPMSGLSAFQAVHARRHRAAQRSPGPRQRTAHARTKRRRLPAAARHGRQRRHRPRLAGDAGRPPGMAENAEPTARQRPRRQGRPAKNGSCHCSTNWAGATPNQSAVDSTCHPASARPPHPVSPSPTASAGPTRPTRPRGCRCTSSAPGSHWTPRPRRSPPAPPSRCCRTTSTASTAPCGES